MTLRAIWVRIKNLPPGSALSRAVDPEQWRIEHFIAADIYDLIAVANGVVQGHSKTPLAPYERPGDRAIKKKKQAEIDRKILEATNRFRRQLAAGGDFDE